MNISLTREYKDEYGEYITDKLSEATIDFNNLLILVGKVISEIKCTVIVPVSKRHIYGIQIDVWTRNTTLYIECNKAERDRLNRFLYANSHRSPLYRDTYIHKKPYTTYEYSFIGPIQNVQRMR